jgi:murein DD-endopeptidase MepM/ murein hydrolase activator NlpD
MAVVTPITENKVDLRPAVQARVRAGEFDSGRTVGNAVAQLGAAGGDFAEQQNTLNIRYAQTAAQRARTEALLKVGEIRSRVSQTSGLDAERARQDAETEIQGIREDTAESLQDPLARRMFSDSFESAVAPDRLRMREHSDQQIRHAEDAEDEASIDLSTTRAVDLRADPEAVAAERATIETNVRRRLRGSSETAITLALRTAYSNIHRQTALAILSADEAGGGLEAMAYVREHAAEISPEHELNLFQAIQPQFDNDVVEGVIGEIEAGVRSGEGAEPTPAPTGDGQVHTVTGTQYDPTHGRSHVTDGTAAHERRSGRQAVDYAAPAGSPIYPPVSGTVAEVGQSGNNGNFVRIRHANGYVTTYLHMRAPSPLSEGAEVTNGTIIGTVGNTGRSHGAHVDFSVKDASGRSLDPEHVTWTGENLPAIAPERNDLAAQYRVAHRVATERGLNSRQYAQVLQRIDQRAAREERLVERAQDEVDRRVLEQMAAAGDNLTNISQVPGYGNASPRLQLEIQSTIRQNTRAAEPTADSTAYLDADDMAYGSREEQEAFLRINVRALPIRRGEQAALQRRQNAIRDEIRTNIDDSHTAAQLGRVDTAIRRIINDPDSGANFDRTRGRINQNDPNRRRFSQLRDAAARAVEREQRTQARQLTDTEIDGAVRAELIQFTVRNQQGAPVAQVPAYEARNINQPGVTTTVRVPAAAEASIRAQYARRGVANPSPNQIVFMYRRSLIYQR